MIHTLEGVPDEESAETLTLLTALTMDGLNRMDHPSMRGWAERAMAFADRMDTPLLQAAGIAAAARGFAFSGSRTLARPARDCAVAVVDALADAELAYQFAIVDLAGAELYAHRLLERPRAVRTCRSSPSRGRPTSWSC